jgi:hypothetical protein
LLFHSRALPAENITSSRPVIQKEEKKLAVLASRPPLESQFIALAPITADDDESKDTFPCCYQQANCTVGKLVRPLPPHVKHSSDAIMSSGHIVRCFITKTY